MPPHPLAEQQPLIQGLDRLDLDGGEVADLADANRREEVQRKLQRPAWELAPAVLPAHVGATRAVKRLGPAEQECDRDRVANLTALRLGQV